MENNKMKKNRLKIISLLLIFVLLTTLCSCNVGSKTTDYAKKDSWAYLESDTDDEKSADVFFICPTVYGGDEKNTNMSLSDDKTKANFLGATNMEKGIYDDNARFFAPYYRQAGLSVYAMPEKDREQYFKTAYSDVREAFKYYMKHYNNNRPIILAGFSQGADMSIRLMKEFFNKGENAKLLVACYAIGWSVTEEELKENPKLKFASGSDDTGVIIAFNSEAEGIDDSLMIPKGTKTLAINPLNWVTDSTRADKELNIGACFTDYEGKITKEIPQLTGAYIDDIRGALKVTDVSAKDYPAVLSIFKDGVFHLYDYQFFYRNLEQNVQDRISSYTG